MKLFFGRIGFTGTAITVVLQYNLSILLFTNRQNVGLLPTQEHYNVTPVRRKAFEAVMAGGVVLHNAHRIDLHNCLP